MIKVTSLIVLQTQLLRSVQVVQESLVEVVVMAEHVEEVTMKVKKEVAIEEVEVVVVEVVGITMTMKQITGEPVKKEEVFSIKDTLIEVIVVEVEECMQE